MISQKISIFLCLSLIFIPFSLAGESTQKVKIAFFINYLSVRGTEVSTYDYADFNETILGNESIIINNVGDGRYTNGKPLPDYSLSSKEKFKKRFNNRYFECYTMDEVDQVLRREKVTILYMQKAGSRSDNKFSKICKNAIHVVFDEFDPHGDVYACISEWLANSNPHMRLPYVPYMVHLPDVKENLRDELTIPHDVVVFGSHGGADSFDIPFAQEAVIETATQHADWYFVFLNTGKFCDLPNVIFLPGTADMVRKTKFINTCDAMVHARFRGETFGLACAEFSIKNKPVITWNGSNERSHITILGNKGLFYQTKNDLMHILQTCGENIHTVRSTNWDAYSERFNPTAVMQLFDKVFIQPLIK